MPRQQRTGSRLAPQVERSKAAVLASVKKTFKATARFADDCRRILSDVEEAESAAEGESTGPSEYSQSIRPMMACLRPEPQLMGQELPSHPGVQHEQDALQAPPVRDRPRPA